MKTKEKICLALLLCQVLCTQANTDINDFKIATWNSNGARWQQVLDSMNAGLDVFAVQEAGSTRSIPGRLVRTANDLPACLGDSEHTLQLSSSTEVDVTEYKWEPHGFYIYHYESKVHTTSSAMVTGTNKQSMVVITRQRAEEIIIFPSEVTHQSVDLRTETDVNNRDVDRTYINRPVLGIRIANSIFLNIHTQPNDVGNEAEIQLNKIQGFMKNEEPSRTWLVMGDFNRTPQSLTLTAPRGRYVKVVKSGQATRERRELDYGVAGGPTSKQRQVDAVTAALLVLPRNPSDHKPVKFN